MCNNCIANPFILHRTITGMKSESERVGDGGEDDVLCDPLSRDVNGVASAITHATAC